MRLSMLLLTIIVVVMLLSFLNLSNQVKLFTPLFLEKNI